MTAPTPAISITLPSATPVTSSSVNAVIQRGRTSPLFDEFLAGTADVTLNNEDRTFDPLDSSGGFDGELVPGRRIEVTATPSGGGAATIFEGRVADWNYEYNVSGRSLAMVSAEDDLAKLARASFDEWTTTNGELPGVRIAAALARPEVDYSGATDLDDGVFPLTDDYVSWGSSVLNYLQLVARSDLGYLFVDRTGQLVFKDRLAFVGASPAVSFADDGSGPSFFGVTTSYGAEELYNYVRVGRILPFHLSEDDLDDPEPQTASDATSIADYDGTFVLDRDGLLLQDDTTCADMADFLLSVYKDPLFRFASISVYVHALSTSDQADVLALDLGDVVEVTWTPNDTGDPITRTCIVEGIRHTIQPLLHEMTFTLGDASAVQTEQCWVIGHATYGKLGALGYPLAF